MTTFRKLIENNDWEGETWFFWLQVEGNEQALERLEKALEAFADENPPPFVLADYTRTPAEVDLLVEEGKDDGGYMASHHRVDGLLTLPESFDDLDKDDLHQDLNKGGIEDWFVKSEGDVKAS